MVSGVGCVVCSGEGLMQNKPLNHPHDHATCKKRRNP